MKRSFRNPLVALGLAGTILAGAAGVATIAMAQETPTPGSQVAPLDGNAARPWAKLAGLAAIVKASGLDRQVFVDGFAAGKTVAEVLADNGVDPDSIKAEILANVEAGLDSIMDSIPDLSDRPGGPGGHRPHFPNLMAGLTVLGDLLALTEDEIKDALISGDTLAEIATANGVDPQTVIDGLVAAADEKLAEAVANDRLTQEQADEISANLVERITTFVNEGMPAGMGSGHRMRGAFPGGMPQGGSDPLAPAFRPGA